MATIPQEKFIRHPKSGEIYQHYKGGQYKVICVARHSETSEPLVVYQSLSFKSMHIRPLNMWFQEVDAPKNHPLRLTNSSVAAGKIERFILIKDEDK